MESFDNERRYEHDDAHEVGSRKPPKHSRFKKGQSGNPRGKLRGTKNSGTLLKQALLATLPVKQNGHQAKITKLRGIVTKLIHQAMQGDYPSIRLLFRYSGLDRRLNESRDENQGLSHEAGELIRRALLGDSYKPEVFGASKLKDKTASTPALSIDQPRSSERSPGQNHKVGYRKPPTHTRFQKGHSGNPAGRPIAPRSFRVLTMQLLDEKVSLTENGRQTRVLSRLQVIFMQIVNRALRGDLKFQALVLEYAPAIDIKLRRIDPEAVERAKVLVRGRLD